MTSAVSKGNQDLMELLDGFNRKERYFLIREALGMDRFRLSDEYRERLGSILKIGIPSDARIWIDYHLDWLAAALVKWCGPAASNVYPNTNLVFGNQEDVDLLVAFEVRGNYQLVLIEGKGYLSWGNAQMLSKAKRLGELFGRDGRKYAGLRVYFCLSSPRQPKSLIYDEWPDWMKPDGAAVWFELPVLYPRFEVNRWDAAQRRKSASGMHFRITQIPEEA